jgi:hypothetical protein
MNTARSLLAKSSPPYGLWALDEKQDRQFQLMPALVVEETDESGNGGTIRFRLDADTIARILTDDVKFIEFPPLNYLFPVGLFYRSEYERVEIVYTPIDVGGNDYLMWVEVYLNNSQFDPNYGRYDNEDNNPFQVCVSTRGDESQPAHSPNFRSVAVRE